MVELLGQKRHTVVQPERIQGDDTVNVYHEEVLIAIVTTDVKDELLDRQDTLHEVHQHVDGLDGLLWAFRASVAHLAGFVKLFVKTNASYIIVVLDGGLR